MDAKGGETFPIPVSEGSALETLIVLVAFCVVWRHVLYDCSH